MQISSTVTTPPHLEYKKYRLANISQQGSNNII